MENGSIIKPGISCAAFGLLRNCIGRSRGLHPILKIIIWSIGNTAAAELSKIAFNIAYNIEVFSGFGPLFLTNELKPSLKKERAMGCFSNDSNKKRECRLLED